MYTYDFNTDTFIIDASKYVNESNIQNNWRMLLDDIGFLCYQGILLRLGVEESFGIVNIPRYSCIYYNQTLYMNLIMWI